VLDEHCYVVDLEDNLLCGVTREDLQAEFGAAAGQELATKMRAPWSSAALAVNAFHCWKGDASKLRLADFVGFDDRFELERRCPNGVSAIPPHLDVVFHAGSRVIAVESKCTEYLSGKRRKPAVGYLELASSSDERASSRFFAALSDVPEFFHLDAYQLIKHYLGLAREFPNRPLELVYLYWEPRNATDLPVFARHREEVMHFAELVSDDEMCGFTSLSYSGHWSELEELESTPAWLGPHLAALRARYDVVV
jgi:hypothetical protein